MVEQELTSFYQGNCTLEFHSLKHLVIEKCPKMQAFVGSSTERAKEASEEGLEGQTDQEGNSSSTIQPFFNEKVVFPALERLTLCQLHKMEKIWHEQLLPVGNFNRLTRLSITNCEKLITIFPSSVGELLQNLVHLSVSYCVLLEDIGEGHNATEREEDAVVVDTIVFRKLVILHLSQLPELTSFYQGNCTLEFHSLKHLVIEKCPKMQAFVGSSTERAKEASEEGLERQTDQEGNSSSTIQPFFNEKVVLHALYDLTLERLDNIKKIWHNELPVDCFNQLNVLTVRECNNLLEVVPSKLLPMLHKLDKLVVRECDLVEEILEQGEDSGEKLVFPNVHTLELVHLPNLKSFYLGNHTLEWPSLTEVILENCPKMQTFSSGLLITPKLHISL